MKEILLRNKCTGCSACMNICPQKAITMKTNNEGFKMPSIDENKCINCELCKNTCPVLKKIKTKNEIECYLAFSKDGDIQKKSSSGGIFSIIANYILENDGVVIGAAFDDDNKLNHIAINNKQDMYKIIGSKYLQSNLNDIFEYIRNNLKNKKVLFVGTPCQVAGLKSFLKKDLDNLICIDLICHGVPSPKLFEKYVKELEFTNGKLLNYNFRDKSTGWNNYSNTMTFEDKKITELSKNNVYMKLFLSNIALRESCYECNFKIENKYSDITLGDFWGVENYYPEMYNKNGVSAIILNSPKGKKIFEIINKEINYKKCNIDEIISGNPSLKYSAKRNKHRTIFFRDLDKLSMNELLKKYYKKDGILKKIIVKFNIIKNTFLNKIKKWIYITRK